MASGHAEDSAGSGLGPAGCSFEHGRLSDLHRVLTAWPHEHR